MLINYIKTNRKPLLVYCASLLLIFIALYVSKQYVLTFTAIVFLSVPFIFGRGLKVSPKPQTFFLGLLLSVVLIGGYLLLFHLLSDRGFDFHSLSLNIIAAHLIVIAFPEEAFFRGYLQQEMGNNLKSIIAVSILFAIAHVLTIFIGRSSLGLHSVSALLTFFPSLIMGYIYYKTGSVWGSTIFHFLSNIAYISTAGFSIFY